MLLYSSPLQRREKRNPETKPTTRAARQDVVTAMLSVSAVYIGSFSCDDGNLAPMTENT